MLSGALVATCVASWLITTRSPCSLLRSKTSGFTKTCSGASGDSSPSGAAVTAAIAE
jgi:hypothetical protein